MKPILLIHGYSAESKTETPDEIENIYATLPKALDEVYENGSAVEIDLSRYISLEDGISLDDVSRALDRALHDDQYRHLLQQGFHAIVHSTGALVLRNWLRRFSTRPSPLENLIHLAGANFGSGLAHIGKGQLAKWGRLVLWGQERGLGILDALELGSSWTLDLHLYLLRPENNPAREYGVREHIVVGSQADASWFEAPIRYVKEDGSDGVVRASASNINFNYVRFQPTGDARALTSDAASDELDRNIARHDRRGSVYHIVEYRRPGADQTPRIPFAVPFQCAHSGDERGIVTGTRPREQVLRLLDLGLNSTEDNWAGRVDAFAEETRLTYEQAAKMSVPAKWKVWVTDPQAQYDGHAQVIFRLRDQDGRPVEAFDIFFESKGELPIKELIEDRHKNKATDGILVFYLRTDRYDRGRNEWVSQIPRIGEVFLEVTATEPGTAGIVYLPMRYRFSNRQMQDFIHPHLTTVVDIELLRLPMEDVYRIVTLPAT
jgi:hypothetical protein